MNKYEMNRKTIIYYIKEIKINILVNTIVYLNKIYGGNKLWETKIEMNF